MNEQFENITVAKRGDFFDFELKGDIGKADISKLIANFTENKALSVFFHYCDLKILSDIEYFHEQLIPDALRANTSLKSIIFKGSGLYTTLAKLIGSLINHPNLENLTVRNYSNKETDYNFFAALSTLLLLNTKLKNLCLEHLEFNGDISQLCHAIATSTTLKELEFWYMTISPQNQQSLVNAIAKNTSITKMQIESCDNDFTEKLQKIMLGRKPKAPTPFFEQQQRSSQTSNDDNTPAPSNQKQGCLVM